MSTSYAGSFGYQWNLHRRTQLDSFTGLPISRQRLFITTRWPEQMPGERILEAGSGAGRFTEVLLSTGAEVFSFDYSDAVRANAANNGAHAGLRLFRADIFRLPLRKESFSKVLCLGVLQHTPDPEAAFTSLAAQVKPGGELVVDLYAFRLSALLHWKYLLRPITKRIPAARLYSLLELLVPRMLPLAVFLRRLAGKAGARLVPVVEYSDLGLPPGIHVQWSILDTFDALSPRYDKPQTISALRKWFANSGFVDFEVTKGPNGIMGRGRKPATGSVALTP